jgi:hypothetical protein
MCFGSVITKSESELFQEGLENLRPLYAEYKAAPEGSIEQKRATVKVNLRSNLSFVVSDDLLEQLEEAIDFATDEDVERSARFADAAVEHEMTGGFAVVTPVID